jgi:hypothetical protein
MEQPRPALRLRASACCGHEVLLQSSRIAGTLVQFLGSAAANLEARNVVGTRPAAHHSTEQQQQHGIQESSPQLHHQHTATCFKHAGTMRPQI